MNQVVEESYLSVLLEDPSTFTLDRAASMSDIASVNSEESGGHYTNLLSKSPSQEANSEGSIVPEDMKTQWRIPVSGYLSGFWLFCQLLLSGDNSRYQPIYLYILYKFQVTSYKDYLFNCIAVSVRVRIRIRVKATVSIMTALKNHFIKYM